MRTRKPDTTSTPAAVAELAAITAQIAALESEHDRISVQLGEAMANQRTGDRNAGTDVGRLSLKRAGLDTDLRDLKITHAALRRTVAEWEAGEAERTAAAARAELERITNEARETEQRLAEQMTAAAETARQLQGLSRQWQQARRAAAGQDVGSLQPPRLAAALFNNSTIEKPDDIRRWLEPRRLRSMGTPRLRTAEDMTPTPNQFSILPVVEAMRRKASA